MNENKTSIKNSNITNSSDEAAIINSLTKYLNSEENLLYTEDLLMKCEKLDINDVDIEVNDEKIYTSLKTVELVNYNVEKLNTSQRSEDFEELVNLEDVKNIEELESFKESQNFESSINLEEIKQIEKTEALEVSPKFEESVNFDDIKNIEGSIIIELDNVQLEQIQNNTQECPYIVIEIPSQKLQDDKHHINSQESNLSNNNTNSPENSEVTFTSLSDFETTSDNENDKNSSSSISPLSNNGSINAVRKRIKKRKIKIRTKDNTIEIGNDEAEGVDQKVKLTNDDTSKMTFTKPITSNRLHRTKKPCINNNSDEHDILLSSPTLTVQRNLTDEEKMKINTSQDMVDNVDEFEEICNFLKNDNYDPAQLSMETIELLDEFGEFNQSTHEKLLADLISSPIRVNDQIQEEYNKDSTPEIEQDISNTFGISLNSEVNHEESNIPETEDDQTKNDHSVKMSNDLDVERQSESENGSVSSSCEDDDSSYHVDHDDDHSDDDSSYHDNDFSYSESESGEIYSDIDLEKLREEDKKIKKSLVIKKEIREKLEKFAIKLKHEVPPQHMLESYILWAPSRQIKSVFDKYTPMKQGLFTKSEDKIIKENWKYFCEVHEWDPANVKPFLQFRYKGRRMIKQEEVVNFARFMARGLPSRSLYSVVARFRRLFREISQKRSQFERSQYTTKEDKIIMAYFKDEKIDHRNRIKKLAKRLNRPCGSLYYRWQILKRKEDREAFLSRKNIQKKVDWDVPLVEKFLKKLMKLTLSDDVEELKDAMIPPMIWKKLEKKMKISIGCLQNFWFNRLHAQLFYERPFYLNDVKVLLIEYMYVKGITDRAEIDWSEIRELFDGIPVRYLMNMLYGMLRINLMKIKSDLGDVINWLYKYRINRMKLTKKEKYLPGMIYRDGKIEIFHRSYPTLQDCDTNNSSEDIC